MKKGQTLKKSKNIGRRFNLLTVLETEITAKGRRYKCVCDCGNVISVDVRDVSRKLSCGCMRGKENWEQAKKGTAARPVMRRWKSMQGYIYVVAPDGHPYADSKNRIYEHRLVVEKRIGRFLYPQETVHHKNGVRWDNRDENLELWVSVHPKGTRVTDLVNYALGILALYEPRLLAEHLRPKK